MKGTVYTLHALGVRQQAARGGRVRRFPGIFGKSMICFLLVCVLTCQPFIIALDGGGLRVKEQTAEALPVSIGPIAYRVFSEIAEETGESPWDLLVAAGLGIAGSTGYNVWGGDYSGSAVEFGGGSGGGDIPKTRPTPSWPAWETLDADQKAQWENNEGYYNAQKWRDIISGTTLGTVYESALSAVNAGEEWVPSSADTNHLNSWKTVANYWKDKQSQTVAEIKSWLGDVDSVFNGNSGFFNGYYTSDWTDYNLAAYTANGYECSFMQINGKYTIFQEVTDSDVVITGLTWVNPRNSLRYWQIISCRVDGYMYNTRARWDQNLPYIDGTFTTAYASTTKTYQGYSYNFNATNLASESGSNGASAVFASDVVFNDLGEVEMNDTLYSKIYLQVLYGVKISEDMQGTPEDISDDTGISMPEDGIGPSTIWDDLTRQNPTPPTPTPDPGYPESDFNPNAGDDDGDYVPETSTPEWQKKTQDQIFTPALNLPFDRMFPFCVIWDISKLMNKLYELGGYQAVSADQSTSLRSLYDKREGLQVQADGDLRGGTSISSGDKPAWTVGHTEIYVPLYGFHVDGMDELELDIWPLAVLLSWLKPFFQLAFIAGLLFVTIVTFRMFIFSD